MKHMQCFPCNQSSSANQYGEAIQKRLFSTLLFLHISTYQASHWITLEGKEKFRGLGWTLSILLHWYEVEYYLAH